MNHQSLKQHIDEKMGAIRVNDELKKTMINQAAKAQPRKKNSAKKIAAAAVAAVLIAAYPMRAAAGQIPYIAQWVYASVSQGISDFLYPVGESCTDNGIRITVESAVNDGYHAQIYFTVQDVEGKGRLGDDLDLCDSCYINIGGDSASTVSVESYDPETQTARCYTYMTVTEDMTDKPVNFGVTMLMANKTNLTWFDTGLKLSDIMPETVSTDSGKIQAITGWSGDIDMPEPKKEELLTPDVIHIPLREGIDEVHISNIGFIGGKLHIQTKWESSFDNHGFLGLYSGDRESFTDDEEDVWKLMAEEIDSVSFVTFEDMEQANESSGGKHLEQVFDIGPDELDNFRLFADLTLDGNIMEGRWKVSYKMRGADKLTFQTDNADAIEITPLGVYVLGYRGEDEPKVVVHFSDGTDEVIDHYEMVSTKGFLLKKRIFCTSCMEEISEHGLDFVSSVTLDGQEAALQS